MADLTRPAGERHASIMKARITQLLQPALQRDGAIFVDATLGMGGHTEAILDACPGLTAYGIDRDPDALALAGRRLERFGDRFVPVHAVNDDAFDRLTELGVEQVDAVLFDLGVSSLQLDELGRGFSYSKVAPLDMRMDNTSGPTAADVLNTYPEAELARILHEYGEERFSRRIAAEVVRRRDTTSFETSDQLMSVLDAAIPAANRRSGGHPGKRTFQALRIEVNDELGVWRRALPTALDHLRVGGRLAVLTFHSLEDRIAKRVLAAGATSTTPPGLPVELPEHAPWLALLARGERPSSTEIAENSRASSARLRVAEKIRQMKGTMYP